MKLTSARPGPFFGDAGFARGDLATGCSLGYLDVRHPGYDWLAAAPNPQRLHEHRSTRPSFRQSMLEAQEMPTPR